MARIGLVEGVVGGADRFTSIAALFPHVAFSSAGETWPERPEPGLDILVVGVDAQQSAEVEAAIGRLGSDQRGVRIVVALQHADVTTTRRLARAGAADVLPAPVSEPALALSLERLLTTGATAGGGRARSGEVVAVLKAGGGVGASALCVQTAIAAAGRGAGQVCLADLDLQFGSAGVYMDLPEAVTIADCLSSGSALAETPYLSALAAHRSGVKLLAAPREIVALETLDPTTIESLIAGLRRDFSLTLVDLPGVWNAWTNQVVHQADRVVLVTHLSVAHIQLVKRQLRILAAQRLDDKPLTLVCNGLSPDHVASVPIKSAERAIGRAFDVTIPEDRRVMTAALNQGVEIAAVRRGTKLEKAINQLADKVCATASTRAAR